MRWWLSLLFPVMVYGQILDVTDVYSVFHLPPLRDTQAGGLISVLSATQAGQRAAILALSRQSANDAWTAGAALYQKVQPPLLTNSPTPFSGTTASALNKLLVSAHASVVVTSAALIVDQPIEIRAAGTSLDLGSAVLTSNTSSPYMLQVNGASGVVISGGIFTAGNSAILVDQASDVTVRNVTVNALTGDGIVITGSSGVHVSSNRISGVSGAGIMIHRGTASSVIERNEVSGTLGYSNVAAAIVLSDREVDLASNPAAIYGPDGYWVVSQPIMLRLRPPHDNVVCLQPPPE